MANPLFGHSMRDERRMIQVIRAWDPAPANPFLGGCQPFAPRKSPPGLLSVDRPPGCPWELAVTLNEDYYTPYLLAQRYANRKTIVSVDNPPVVEDEKTVALQSILKSWDPPAFHHQQRRYKRAIAGQPSAAISSVGQGTAAWTGFSASAFLPKLVFQQHITRAWEIPQLITISLPQQSIGSVTTGAWRSAGAGTAIWTGSSLQGFVPKRAFQQQIIRAWDAPAPLPQSHLPRFLGSSALAALNATGTGTTTWIGSSLQPFLAKGPFQKHIIRGWEEPLVVTISLPQQSIGATGTAGAWSSTGTSTATWIGSSLRPFLAKAAFQKHIVQSWELPPIVTISLPQVTFGAGATSGNLSSVGVGTATWKGASSQPAVPKLAQPHIVRSWERPSFYPEIPLERLKLPPQLLGEPAASGPPGYIWDLLELAPEDTTAYFRVQPRYKVGRIASASGNLSSLGVGLARWIGKKSASAVFFNAGQGVARFVGTSSAVHSARLFAAGHGTARFTSTSARAPNLDGWRPRREQLERRRRKDEQEIAAILAAVLPIVQSGTVSPTRLSVPRKGRTLQ